MQHLPQIIFWSMIFFVVYKCEMREDMRVKANMKKCTLQLDQDSLTTAPINITGTF